MILDLNTTIMKQRNMMKMRNEQATRKNNLQNYIKNRHNAFKQYVLNLEKTRQDNKEAKPVLEEAKPVLEEAKPVLEEAKPVLEEAKPVLEENGKDNIHKIYRIQKKGLVITK